MVKKQTYEELVPKWTILSGHPVAHIASHEFYPKFISIAEMAMRLQESLDMTSEKNLHKLSQGRVFKNRTS